MTLDVVTPMVNDPLMFGAIAAANALSDVYAMGGVPHVALSFVGFPSSTLPLSDLTQILEGISEVAREANVAIVGGHTMVDPEPKAGLSVTGTVDRARVWSHRGARPGQALLLTKPIGTGIAINALKKSVAPSSLIEDVTSAMRRLNRVACDVGRTMNLSSATDITGFGLLGHLSHIARDSGVTIELQASAVPMFSGVRELCEAGHVPGGTKKNLDFVAPYVEFSDDVSETTRLVLADAQTSGGLVLLVDEADAPLLEKRLLDAGERPERIGTTSERRLPNQAIIVRP